MPVETMSIDLNSKAHNEIHDITGAVDQAVRQSELSSGTVTIFSPSSTSGLTTVEYESGCVADLERMFEQIAPQGQEYQHNLLRNTALVQGIYGFRQGPELHGGKLRVDRIWRNDKSISILYSAHDLIPPIGR